MILCLLISGSLWQSCLLGKEKLTSCVSSESIRSSLRCALFLERCVERCVFRWQIWWRVGLYSSLSGSSGLTPKSLFILTVWRCSWLCVIEHAIFCYCHKIVHVLWMMRRVGWLQVVRFDLGTLFTCRTNSICLCSSFVDWRQIFTMCSIHHLSAGMDHRLDSKIHSFSSCCNDLEWSWWWLKPFLVVVCSLSDRQVEWIMIAECVQWSCSSYWQIITHDSIHAAAVYLFASPGATQ